MKSKWILLLASCICFSVADAQKFHLGIMGGAEVNRLSGKTFNDQFSFGYQVGGFAEVHLAGKFWVQPEVKLSQTNIDTSSTFSSVYQFNKISTIHMGYLQIPLLLSFQASKFVFLQAGPQYGILLDPNNSLLKNGQNAFKTGNLSALAGVQVHFSHFRVYGRYAIGLDNINDIDNKDQWKSQSIQLGIGFSIL